MKTAVDQSADEITAISEILKPYLHVEMVRFSQLALARGPVPGPYGFEGFVRADLAGITSDLTPRAARARMLEFAENALEALTVAGWFLVGGLRMEVKGTTEPWTQTLDGKLVQQGGHYDMEFTVRFKVDRPR